MGLSSKGVANCGLLGGRNNNLFLIILIVVFFIFCCGGCTGGSNIISSCCNPCGRRCRRRSGIGNISIIWVIVIFAILAGGNRNTNTNIINLDTDGGNELDGTSTGF